MGGGGGGVSKSDWQSKPLADVCQIKPPKAEARQRISGKALVSFVPMEDLGIDQKIMVPTQTRPLEDVAGSYTYFADGDVLLAKITPCFENGKLGIADNLTNGIGFGSSEYIVFRPSPAVDKEWLYYFLSRESFRTGGAERMSGAVGHKRVSKEFIESYPIPVPPLPEQQRIVAILDEAFDGIATAKANTEKNLQNARALFESHLQSVFTERGEGWVEKPLGECFRLKSGDGLTSKAMKAGAFPVFGGNGIAGTHDEFNLSGDNVIIGRVGALCGNARHIIGKIWLTDNAFKVVDYCHEFDGAFLTYLLNYKNLRSYARQAAQPVISNSSLRDLVLQFPVLAEQQRIAASFDVLLKETQRLESLYQRKLTALDDLKKFLLHQAFSGQL